MCSSCNVNLPVCPILISHEKLLQREEGRYSRFTHFQMRYITALFRRLFLISRKSNIFIGERNTMRSLLFTYALFLLIVLCFAQHKGVARMQELRTNIDPVRSFDLPEDAPRARIISTDFLQRTNRKIKKVFKVSDAELGRTTESDLQDDSRQEDFRRWKLDELTDRDMRSSKEVKSSVRSPFGRSESKEEEKNIGEFFPTRRFLKL